MGKLVRSNHNLATLDTVQVDTSLCLTLALVAIANDVELLVQKLWTNFHTNFDAVDLETPYNSVKLCNPSLVASLQRARETCFLMGIILPKMLLNHEALTGSNLPLPNYKYNQMYVL
jgi:hypothetical protein